MHLYLLLAGGAGGAFGLAGGSQLDLPLLEGPLWSVEWWVVVVSVVWCQSTYQLAVPILALPLFYCPLQPPDAFALDLLTLVHKIKGIRHSQWTEERDNLISVGSIAQ